MKITKKQLIDLINTDPKWKQAWQDESDTPIEDYLSDYSDRKGIVQTVATDLGITQKDISEPTL
jgi:hypothetical protein